MITNDLKRAKSIIEKSIKDLEEKPDQILVKELIEACKAIEPTYKKMCDDSDEQCCDPKGTSYNDGISIEFYIEADQWHIISECLRKMFPNEKFEYDE